VIYKEKKMAEKEKQEPKAYLLADGTKLAVKNEQIMQGADGKLHDIILGAHIVPSIDKKGRIIKNEFTVDEYQLVEKKPVEGSKDGEVDFIGIASYTQEQVAKLTERIILGKMRESKEEGKEPV